MDLFDWIPAITLHMYVVSSGFCLAAFFVRRKLLQYVALLSACLSFALHTVTLILPFFLGMPNRGIFILVLGWLIVAIAILCWRILRQPTFVLLSVPIVTLVVLLSLLISHDTLDLPPKLSGMFFSIHVLFLSLSLGFMVLGFLASVLFIAQDRRLKKKRPTLHFFKDLPSLTLLDRINAFTVYAGFPLFTLGLISGFVNIQFVYANFFTGDPKEWMSLLIWCLYAYYFKGRIQLRLYGRKAAILAMWLFALSVFSLTIVNLLFSTHHAFMGLSYVP